MIKYCISLVAILFFSNSFEAQSYLNELDDNPNRIRSVSQNLEVTSVGIVVSGSSQTEEGFSYSNFLFNAENEEFEEISSVPGYTLVNYAEAFSKCTGGFVQAGLNNNMAWGAKFLDDGSLDWQFHLENEGNYEKEFHVAKELENGDFLFAGPSTYYNEEGWAESSNLLLLRVNSFGDAVWTREYSVSEEEFLRINGIFELENGELLLSGGVYHDWDHLLIKIDSEGFIQNEETDIYIWGTEEFNEFVPWVIQEGTDEFIVAYSIGQSVFNGGMSNARLAFMRFNSTEMEGSDEVIGLINYSGQNFMDFIPVPNGGYAILWQNWGVLPIESAIIKLNSELSLEWTKSYVYSENTDNANLLFDLEVLSDGSFVAGGNATGVDDAFPQKIWLIKTDLCGDLEWQGCSTVVEEFQNEMRLLAYPNPSSGSFRIEINENNSRVNGELIVRGSQGQKIIQLPIETNVLRLDLSDYPRGIYLVTVVLNKAVSVSEIVIIE